MNIYEKKWTIEWILCITLTRDRTATASIFANPNESAKSIDFFCFTRVRPHLSARNQWNCELMWAKWSRPHSIKINDKLMAQKEGINHQPADCELKLTRVFPQNPCPLHPQPARIQNDFMDILSLMELNSNVMPLTPESINWNTLQWIIIIKSN